MNSTPSPATDDSAHPIVFFDGMCGLCNRVVDWLLRADRNAVLRFSPLQGETAKLRLPAKLREGLETIVMLDRKGLHVRSSAVLQACLYLPLGPQWVPLVRIVPSWLRDAVYRVIARRRDRWFGRRDQCRAPALDERARFLD